MKTQVCLGLQENLVFLASAMLKPRLLSLGNKKKDFYPSWMIDTLRAAPVTEDRHPGFAESGVKDPSTTVFSIQLYRAILSAEGEKKTKNPTTNCFCGCTTLAAEMSQQFH